MVILLVAVPQWENEGNTFLKHSSRAQEAFSFHVRCLTTCPQFGSVSTYNIGNDK